jgi:hypothetical protein
MSADGQQQNGPGHRITLIRAQQDRLGDGDAQN